VCLQELCACKNCVLQELCACNNCVLQEMFMFADDVGILTYRQNSR
jgi:hypothetical protein